MDTGSLYIALAHDNLYLCFRPARKGEWESLREKGYDYFFRADASNIFWPEKCYSRQNKHNSWGPELNKEKIMCIEMICFCSKTYCCYNYNSNKCKFTNNDMNKRTKETWRRIEIDQLINIDE